MYLVRFSIFEVFFFEIIRTLLKFYDVTSPRNFHVHFLSLLLQPGIHSAAMDYPSLTVGGAVIHMSPNVRYKSQ